MKHLTKILTLSLLALLMLAGCKKDEPKVTLPTAYAFVTDGTNYYYTSLDLNTLNMATKSEKDILIRAADYYAGDVYGYAYDNNFFYKITHGTGTYEQIGASNVGWISGMSYDYSTNTMFCVISGRKLGKVNLKDGSVSVIGELGIEHLMYAFACSLSGQLYGITYRDRENGMLWSIDKTTGKATKIGDTGISAEGGSMAFHHPSGKLYWANALDEARIFFLYEVNPSTAKTTKMGQISFDKGYLYGIPSFYFPYDNK